jgi:hypothetical protein
MADIVWCDAGLTTSEGRLTWLDKGGHPANRGCKSSQGLTSEFLSPFFRQLSNKVRTHLPLHLYRYRLLYRPLHHHQEKGHQRGAERRQEPPMTKKATEHIVRVFARDELT